MELNALNHVIDTDFEKYVDFLCNICGFEATARDVDVLNEQIDYIQDFAVSEGFSVTRTRMESCGDFLSIDVNEGEEKGCVFLAHTDTVHNKGAFGEIPVKRDDDRIIAPGVSDCKGGIPIALLVMKALSLNGYKKHLRLILTSDEEISNSMGGEAEQKYFFETVSGFPYAINCETTEGDEVVVSRRGIIRCRIDIKGVPGHSGIHYFESINPIEEAAHKILALQGKSTRGGITYSCNIIEAGTYENIIPETCRISVDIRVMKHSDFAVAEGVLEQVVNTSFVEGTSATLTYIGRRPPMEANPETAALFERLKECSIRHGLGSLVPVDSGGGSDSCYTQMAGVTSICGMGAPGEFYHTNKEYASIKGILKRIRLLTYFLCDENN